MSCTVFYHPVPPEEATTLKLPLFEGIVRCGMSRFPSPAEAFAKEMLDLSKRLISNPASTVLSYAGDDSMIDEGIFSGDLLIIDKSLSYGEGSVCVIPYYGEFICKKLHLEGDQVQLLSANRAANYPPIIVNEGEELSVFGVVKYVIHQL